MLTRFQEIHPGDEFECGPEGSDRLAYKVSAAEACRVNGPQAGLRLTCSPGQEYLLTGKHYNVRLTPSDIERIAVSLIGQTAVHTGLALWTKSMGVDPNETRGLDEFIGVYYFEADEGSIKLSEFLRKEGYVTPQSGTGGTPSAAAAIRDRQPRGSRPEKPEEQWQAARDAVILELGEAVIDYRRRGRLENSQAPSLWERGAAILKSTTPLAAAIVEYHQAMLKLGPEVPAC